MAEDTILIDIRASDMSLNDVLNYISYYQTAHPDEEVILDGDRHAIVSRSVAA